MSTDQIKRQLVVGNDFLGGYLSGFSFVEQIHLVLMSNLRPSLVKCPNSSDPHFELQPSEEGKFTEFVVSFQTDFSKPLEIDK